MKNVDDAILNLDAIGGIYSDDEDYDYDFVSNVNKLNNDLLRFNKKINKFTTRDKRTDELIGVLNNYAEGVSLFKERLITREVKKLEYELERYKAIVDALLRSKGDIKKAVYALRNLAQNKDVAHTIRCKAIESIGIIGDQEELEILLDISNNADPIIRKLTISSMGEILSH